MRNLSFKADEDALQNLFSKHGQVVDVNILKKADGRMVGCAFVEFKKVTEATNALKDLNSSQMLGRFVTQTIIALFSNIFQDNCCGLGGAERGFQ